MVNYNPPSDSTRTLKERRKRTFGRMSTLMDAVNAGRKLTPGESDEYQRLERDLRDIDATVKIRKDSKRSNKGAKRGVPEIQGTPNEPLVPGQSMAEWVRRAAENGVTIQRNKDSAPERVRYHSPEYLNEYWAQRMGLKAPGAELRALGEDTSGSGLAITPQAWTASFVDFLYPLTVLGRAGITRFAMPTELYNMPVFTAPAQPAWIAENSTVGIDANPAFSTLQFSAMGGFKEITLYSIELAQDSYIQGGLPGMLALSAARNFALAVDVSGIQGIAGNTGNPGLINESGFVSRAYTGDGGSGKAPVDTTEFSIVNELIANKNVDLSIPG